jgi:TolB-like protein/DNA-binding SARP family transcriptional activator/Flp pilus assembly protein TadD
MSRGSINIRLFGNFEVTRDADTSLLVRGERSRAILACLACEAPGYWARDRLASTLWEGRELQQARSSLRQELVRLRSDLGLDAAADWTRGGNVVLPNQISLDVVDFNGAIREGRALEAAILYRGDLLQDSRLISKKFQNWIATKRNTLRSDAIACFIQVLQKPPSGSSIVEEIAERLASLDPASEIGHRWLMQHYASRGQFLSALDRYYNLAQVLKRDFGREPSPETQQLLSVLSGSASRVPNPAREARTETADWISEINRQHHVAAAPKPTPLLPVPGRPSLAVAPFVDLSGNGSDDALADGLTEEVTASLSRIPGLFVSARQSSMVYKRAAIDVRTIALELGVRYLLEGSVELRDDKMRVHARLIVGDTGLHHWANSYELPLGRLFDVRDQIVSEVAAELVPALMRAEIERALNAPPENFDAWTRLQRANGYILFQRHRDGLSAAVTELNEALQLDPNYAMAHALLGAVHTWRSTWSQSEEASQERALALKLGERALRLEPENSSVLLNCGEVALYSAGNLDSAVELFEKAATKCPSDAQGLVMFANGLRVAGGDPQQSLRMIDQATRISPRDPRSHRWLHYLGWCHWKLGDLEQMEAASRGSIELYSDAPAQWLELTCALGLQGKLEESRTAGTVLKKLAPEMSAKGFFETAKRFYGKRFPGEVEAEYRALCATLEDAL